MKSLPGWTTTIDEVSNGVYKVALIDKYGRKAVRIDSSLEETIERTLSDAFEIEKQISTNWNKFLFDLCIERLVNEPIIEKSFNDKDFGSWFIEFDTKRLLYDGRDACFISQLKSDNNWLDNYIIKEEELKYETFFLFLKHME